MADFCAECSIEEFGQNFGDMGFPLEEGDDEDTVVQCLCEGCGVWIWVDHLGFRRTSREFETRVVDGEEQKFFIPRDPDEVKRVRGQLMAAGILVPPAAPSTAGEQKPWPQGPEAPLGI